MGDDPRHQHVDLVPDVLRDTRASVVDVEEECKNVIQLALHTRYTHLIVDDGDARVLVAAMKAHRSNRTVQEYGCWALGYIADRRIAGGMDGRDSVLEAEGGLAVLDAMQLPTVRQREAGFMRQAPNFPVYQKGLFVLSALTVDPTFRAWFINVTGITQVLYAMRVNASSVEIQKHGCAVIRNISESFQGYDQVNMLGGIDVIARAMREHRQSPEVTVACEAFYNIAKSGENCMEILNVGGIAAILDAIRDDTKRIELFQEGSRALSRLALKDGASEEIGRLGGVALVVSVMSEHAALRRVQIRGCEVLRIMARIDSNREEIVNTQGVEVILSAMQRHPSILVGVECNKRLAMQFCGAIRELARGLALDVTVNLRLRIATAVVAAMREHIPDTTVCKRGCEALKALALYAEAGVPIMDAGGREAVEDVMERWFFDKELHQDPDNREVFEDTGGMEFVSHMMHMADMGIMEIGSEVARAFLL
ncbi:armadillo-type protein [Baffinella frigidus]|nr:armadillo-type protein [Cryptophyta sp. CCMP2293]